jgi:hypothetical protein
MPPQKRQREVSNLASSEGPAVKRARENREVIILSSEGDDDNNGASSVSTTTTDNDEAGYLLDIDWLDHMATEDYEDQEAAIAPEPAVEASCSSSPSKGKATPEKGKGKEMSLPPLDLHEELECVICCMCVVEVINVAYLMVVPHICVPCGHGACGPCLFKWVETSATCPECRTKLSTKNPLIRDYILERIIQKYTTVTLTPEEMETRDRKIRCLTLSSKTD